MRQQVETANSILEKMTRDHQYALTVKWAGNRGSGTSSYEAYGREHTILIPGKPEIQASADPLFRGNIELPNPEELFLASISSCHMLWYLHLCADAGVVVLDYIDRAEGTLEIVANGSGRFTAVRLQPVVTIEDKNMAEKAVRLHQMAHEKCFIANSCNFPIRLKPVTRVPNF